MFTRQRVQHVGLVLTPCLILAIALPGCDSRAGGAGLGALIGGGAGAGIGYAAGGSKGALIGLAAGAAIGGVAGYVIADVQIREKAKEEERRKAEADSKVFMDELRTKRPQEAKKMENENAKIFVMNKEGQGIKVDAKTGKAETKPDGTVEKITIKNPEQVKPIDQNGQTTIRKGRLENTDNVYFVDVDQG